MCNFSLNIASVSAHTSHVFHSHTQGAVDSVNSLHQLVCQHTCIYHSHTQGAVDSVNYLHPAILGHLKAHTLHKGYYSSLVSQCLSMA